MPTLQIRDVPKAIHEKLLKKAKEERRSLSQQALYLLEKILEQEDNQKTRRKLLIARLQDRKPIDLSLTDPTELVRTDRGR